MKAQRPLAQYLDPPTDEARISRMWSAIRLAPEPRSRATWTLAAIPLAAAAAVLGWFVWPTAAVEPTPPAAFLPPAAFEAAESGATFELADGSRIELEAHTLLTTIASDDQRFVTLLERGRATFEVRPGGSRRWVVESGLATIEVVGTVFEVERDDERVEVRVRRGVVLVRGERVPDRVVRLSAGEALTVTAARVIEAAAEAHPERSEARAEPAAEAPPVRPRLRPGPRPTRPSSAAAPLELSVGELMRRAAEARRSGDARRAAGLLQRASAHGDDPRAALASFTLGRIEMDELGRRARARQALRRALALGLPQRLEQQARRRLQQLGR